MKIFIKTYGCTLNQADSLIMHNLLKKEGFEFAGLQENADIIIVNTCTVKEPTESKILDYLRTLKNKKVIITGCLVHTNTVQLKNKFGYPLIGCTNIFDIARICRGLQKHSLKRKKQEKVNLVSIRKNEIIEIIPICEGCLGNCSYCATKFARGQLYSYKPESIISHFKKALKNGAKEFWLTAQDLGAYGKDINTNIIQLLDRLVKFKGFYKIRLGMMNPKYAIKYKKELKNLLEDKHLFKFLHLPVQSGSNKILKLMNRDYKIKDFIKTVKYFKSNIGNLTLSTDIIVGFPTETKKDFNQTLTLIKSFKPDIINISKYWKRKHTKAASMKQLNAEIVKKRVKELVRLHKNIALEKNKEYVGRELNVFIDEKTRARTDSYKPVRNVKAQLGTYKSVKIKKASKTSLFA